MKRNVKLTKVCIRTFPIFLKCDQHESFSCECYKLRAETVSFPEVQPSCDIEDAHDKDWILKFIP